jgi:translation initiation factor 2 beta subunit (eIF-2beta)/eIF-5
MESSMATSPSYSGAADKAMAFAAQLRADRERHEARRREEQRRIEAMRPINKHVLKVFGGQQLALKLNS